MDKSRFDYLIDRLNDSYGLKMKRDHDRVCTFSEEGTEIFKIMFGYNEEKESNELVVTFHLTINPALAVKWYHALSNIEPYISLKQCYYIDDRNEIFYGFLAEDIKRHKDEQAVLTKWLDSDEDPVNYINAKIHGREDRNEALLDRQAAIDEFNAINKTDDDVEH